MIFRGILVGAALLLVGCAERDNPFDPVNRPLVRQVSDTSWVPVPRLFSRVLLPESANRVSSGYTYYANPHTALSEMVAGDTLWIPGGDRYFAIDRSMTLRARGSERFPVVVRSYGGQATFRLVPRSNAPVSFCLEITQPYVRIEGVTFINCETSIFAADLDGPLTLDSVKFVNSLIALDLQRVTGRVKLHHVEMTGTVQDPPFLFTKLDSLDTVAFSWTPRSN